MPDILQEETPGRVAASIRLVLERHMTQKQLGTRDSGTWFQAPKGSTQILGKVHSSSYRYYSVSFQGLLESLS